MHPSPSALVRARRALAFVTVFALSACGADAPDVTGLTIDAVRVEAPGGKGGGGGNVAVSGTSPSELPQGVVSVELTITGSGFESGSDVGFEIDGTATGQIVTNAVTYIDESTLVANVDVAADALETLYDVAVRNGPKKKGVGVDLLRVTAPDVRPVVQPQVLSTEFSGSQEIFGISGEWMVGSDEDFLCDFVYNITTDTKDCITVPWADPTDDAAVLIVGVTPEGVIVGWGEDASGELIPFRIDYANDPTTILQLERPAGWSRVFVAWDDPINGQGLIVGSAQREIPRAKGPKHRPQYESVAILWNPDGTVRSMSAPGDWRPTGGASDVLPDGTVRVGMSPPGVWDGVDGSEPRALNTTNLPDPSVSVIAPDGTIYGTDRDRVLVWDTPSSPPAVLVDLGYGGDGLAIFALDDHGNLLGRVGIGRPGVCIDLDDPVGGITLMAPLEEPGGSTPLGGRGGRLFGHPSQTISYWDITGVDGGCGTT